MTYYLNVSFQDHPSGTLRIIPDRSMLRRARAPGRMSIWDNCHHEWQDPQEANENSTDPPFDLA